MTKRVSISLTFTEFKFTDMKTHNHGESAEILGVLGMLPVVDSPGALATAPQRGQGTWMALRPLLSPLLGFGLFLTQGSNPCLLHWQVNALPLSIGEAHMYFHIHVKMPIRVCYLFIVYV